MKQWKSLWIILQHSPVCHGERACRFTTCVLSGFPLTRLPGAWCNVIACKLQVFRRNRNITDRTEVYDDVLFGKPQPNLTQRVAAWCHCAPQQFEHILNFWKRLQAVAGE